MLRSLNTLSRRCFLLTSNTLNMSSSSSSASGKISDAEWKKRLTNEQYRILRRKDTEYPGTGKYNKHYETGVYQCAGCGENLYE